MKKLVIILSVLISIGSFKSQSLNNAGLYIDSDGEVFNGVVSQTQAGIKSDFNVKEGVLTGEANYYFASGNLMESGYFTSGKKDQKWIRYNENGSVAAIAFFNLGKKTGTWLVFDDSGKKRFEMTYSDGQKTGVWTSWDENGAVASTKDYTKVN